MKRLRDYALTGLLFAGFAILVAFLEQASVEEFAGNVRVVDGDSLELGVERTRIRIEGIDAPEIGQMCKRDRVAYDCGRKARSELRGIIANRQVTCDSASEDRYGRRLATCSANGRNIGREMVARGWAVSYGSYPAQERLAKEQELGLWAGTFDLPSDWRQLTRGNMSAMPSVSGLGSAVRDWWQSAPDD